MRTDSRLLRLETVTHYAYKCTEGAGDGLLCMLVQGTCIHRWSADLIQSRGATRSADGSRARIVWCGCGCGCGYG